MSLREILRLTQETADTYLIKKPYIVGGIPRDIYLKIPNVKTTDIDITTNSPDSLRLGVLVAEKIDSTFEVADDYHVTVYSPEMDLDFSSHFVSEGVKEYLNGKFAGLEEAFSRDFTINTLHQDLVTAEISDPTEMGFEDIKNKIIKTPVPPEITLTDDPRRIYRAINLAVRYNFTIDPKIKEFVLDSPEIFDFKNIKDRYISSKISKSLYINEELTISLLKELNLFKKVPLSGRFKDALIRKKYLADYLENPTLDYFLDDSKQKIKTLANISSRKERMFKLSEIKKDTEEDSLDTDLEEVVEEKTSINMPVPSSPLYPRIYTGDSARPLQGQFNTSESVDNNAISESNKGLMSFYG
jgi:tRNA nucleotidyltransferase/poly(A) polymerase